MKKAPPTINNSQGRRDCYGSSRSFEKLSILDVHCVSGLYHAYSTHPVVTFAASSLGSLASRILILDVH
eukprot:1194593-Prorocentrum_minimum.AAC.4